MKYDDNDSGRNYGRSLGKAILWSGLFWVGLALLVIFLFGCVSIRGPKTGFQKTTEEPLHAETGAGITLWKVPILGIGGWGTGIDGGAPSVIVHKYDYQAQPPALAPGTPPSPPSAGPPVGYKTIYESAWDDPTLVIFKNDSYHKIRIEIDGQRPIVLAPYGATADLHLGVGEHQARLTIEKPTRAHGTLEVVRFSKIYIHPEGRSQIFHLYDY